MIKRLGKRQFKKIAEHVSVGLGDQAIQLITDAMANSMTIDIEYMGSGYRSNILPYGWSSSKDGNLLIMCYKEDSSIRSYRFDRLLQVFVDDSLIQAYQSVAEQPEIQDTSVEQNSPNDYLIPTLPDIDQILEESENEQPDMPYDEAIESLENTQEVNIDVEPLVTQDELVNNINENQESEVEDGSLEEQYNIDEFSEERESKP